MPKTRWEVLAGDGNSLHRIAEIVLSFIKIVIIEIPMVRTQIQLTKKQAVRLKRLAASEHSSMAAIIRRAVDRLVASKGATDPEEQRMRAIAVAGRFHSGTPDIAEKHDRYLAEAFRE